MNPPTLASHSAAQSVIRESARSNCRMAIPPTRVSPSSMTNWISSERSRPISGLCRQWRWMRFESLTYATGALNYNGVGIVDRFTSPAVLALTGNSTTIYAAAFADLGRDGPVVIDSPAGAYGVIDDYWQRPVVEVGPFGPDKGKGGKFLLVPPGYKGDLPKGYFIAHSLTNRVMYLARGFVRDGDVKSAVDTLAKISIYPLSQAGNPPKTQIFMAGDKGMDSIAPRGFEYWERLADIINQEPVDERDRFFPCDADAPRYPEGQAIQAG